MFEFLSFILAGLIYGPTWRPIHKEPSEVATICDGIETSLKNSKTMLGNISFNLENCRSKNLSKSGKKLTKIETEISNLEGKIDAELTGLGATRSIANQFNVDAGGTTVKGLLKKCRHHRAAAIVVSARTTRVAHQLRHLQKSSLEAPQ